jgi:hypothetical protein
MAITREHADAVRVVMRKLMRDPQLRVRSPGYAMEVFLQNWDVLTSATDASREAKAAQIAELEDELADVTTRAADIERRLAILRTPEAATER